MNISERIEILRKEKGISLVRLNEKIGAYRGKITEVKKNKASFNDYEIKTLAKALSTSVDYLLGETDDPTPVAQKESPPQSGELTGLRKEAWDLIETMDDYTLSKFIKIAKAMLEG